jgi:competence protein ComEC
MRARAVPVRRPGELCGKPRHFGRATVTVLAPCPDFVAGANPNDNSLVLRIAFGQRSVLLVGDAEAAEEGRLLEQHRGRLSADLLKVGHHGSSTSSSADFLHEVRPDLATVSCGVRNRFGHPHPDALARLLAVGALPLRLDRVGSVAWRTDGQRVRATAFSAPR